VLTSHILTVSPYGAGAILAFAAVLAAVHYARLRDRWTEDKDRQTGSETEIYLLRQGKLVEANFSGRRNLDRFTGSPDDDTSLRRRLSLNFPDADRLLAAPKMQGDLACTSSDMTLQALREVAGSEIRIEVSSRLEDTPGPKDIHNLSADAAELRMLRANTEVAPFLLWRQNEAGRVTWANRSYLDAATEVFGQDRVTVWPLPSLFPALGRASQMAASPLRRLQAEPGNDGSSAWYDCHIAPIDNDMLCTAFRADEAVRSETRRREFTQTLTKTFADLAIGLAIFDRSRRLALFNPALTDLTSLAPDFLTSRPSLIGFLDQLRENRVMPEPRDYREWRKSISQIESAAMNGTYMETWSLPDGQTYRVSGRPHPDGALALLFEDISAEMSLTRRFRAQLEQSHGVIDSLEDAVAIFSPVGDLTFANSAYRDLWDEPEDTCVVAPTVVDASRRWHEMTAPTPVWGDFREFAFQGRERSEWSAQVTLRDGRSLRCRFVPQKAGATLVVFSLQFSSIRASKDLREAV
jgi:PAS domain-containing protein